MMNPAYYKNQWDEFGMILFAYLESLLLSPWNCKYLYETLEDMFANVLTGYYFMLVNIMVLEESYGDHWTQHFLPLVTVQNTCGNVGHFIARCMWFPKDVPFLPWCQREWPIEPHFGEVKKPYRGMPKYKDMILGTIQQYGMYKKIKIQVANLFQIFSVDFP